MCWLKGRKRLLLHTWRRLGDGGSASSTAGGRRAVGGSGDGELNDNDLVTMAETGGAPLESGGGGGEWRKKMNRVGDPVDPEQGSHKSHRV